MIFTIRYESNPKANVWNGSKKFKSVKIHVFKKASVAKLFSGMGFIKTTDHRPIDHQPTDPLTTYPPTHRPLTHWPTNQLLLIYLEIEDQIFEHVLYFIIPENFRYCIK